MELYERLIELRKKAGLSQEKLAEMLDISRQAVSKWENGTTNPDINNIVQLGKVYDVSTDYILLGKTQEAEQSADLEHAMEESTDRNKFQINGFIWFGLGVLAILVLYFVTNIF